MDRHLSPRYGQADVRAYGHVITKFSGMGRLPHFLSYGALSRGWSSAVITINNNIIIIAERGRNTSRLYIHDLIMGALITGHSGHLGVQNNAMICLSDHKTIDSVCPITNTQSNLILNQLYIFLTSGRQLY